MSDPVTISYHIMSFLLPSIDCAPYVLEEHRRRPVVHPSSLSFVYLYSISDDEGGGAGIITSMAIRIIIRTRLLIQTITRFKRVGPNAMRGRGIGAARGRATIMRGKLIFLVFWSSKSMFTTSTMTARKSMDNC